MIDNDAGALRLCALLVTLIEEVRGLRADLAERKSAKKPHTLPDADRVVLVELLPAVREMFGEGEFGVGLLIRRSSERSSVAQRVKRAIAGMNALRLGRLLVRAANVASPISTLYVHLVRRSRSGAVLCVSENTAEHRQASSFAARNRARISP